MTSDAQAALRRIIEQYSTNTRFCIICNYISKIIDPLASRCVKFRFSPIAKDAQIERLKMICQNEKVQVASEEVFAALVEISAGDLRRSINTLQTASAYKAKNLTVKDVQSISGIVPEDVIRKIDKVMQTTEGFGEVQQLAADLILEGFDVQQLLYQVLDFILGG